jgi:FdhE protein
LTYKVNLSKRILQGIEEWALSAHSSMFLDFYHGLLMIQAEAEEKAISPEFKLDKDEITKRLNSGQPILNYEDLYLNWEQVNAVFHSIVCLLAKHAEILGPVPKSLIAEGFTLPPDWVKVWLTVLEIPPRVNGDVVPPLLRAALVQQTLRPFLIGYGQALKGTFNQDTWRRSNCPVCGAKPEFAYLEKEVGARWCLCSACATEWLFKRMQCPYCENVVGTSLSFLGSDDGLYRLYLCEQCKNYLKAIDLRKTTRDVVIAVESLTTVSMDSQAQEKGYHRGA